MTKLVKANGSQLPVGYEDIFSTDNLDDLIEGAGGGFGVMSFRGSKFRVKSGGEETLITDADGDPVPSVPLVLVKAQREISKIFYKKNYEEGDDAAPDCFSLDGISPDQASPEPQANKCANCPMNEWGSRITDSGKKAKKCSDNRRIAVVPAGRRPDDADANILLNEQYGGPMLLRVPPASLKDMVTYAKSLKAKHDVNYNRVVTLVGFDPDVSFPKLTFKAVRRLTPEEEEVVAGFYADGSIDRILSMKETEVVQQAAPKAEKPKAVDTDFEFDETPAPKAKKAAPKDEFEEDEPAPKAKAKPAAKPATRAKAKVEDEDDAPTPKAKAKAKPAHDTDSFEAGVNDVISELEGLDSLG